MDRDSQECVLSLSSHTHSLGSPPRTSEAIESSDLTQLETLSPPRHDGADDTAEETVEGDSGYERLMDPKKREDDPNSLPVVGSAWRSTDALKMRCYTLALKDGLAFGIHQSASTSLHLGCTAHGYGSSACPFRVIARLTGPTETPWIVHASEGTHSHRPLEGLDRRSAIHRIEARIGRLESGQEIVRPKKKKLASALPKLPKQLESKTPPIMDSSSEEELEDAIPRIPPTINHSGYPSASEAAPEVAVLLRSNPNPALPPSSQKFPSAHALLILLYAYAATHGFTFFRKSGWAVTTSASFLCSFGHQRHKQTRQTLCNWRLTVAANPDGTWSLSQREGEHNHSTSAGSPKLSTRLVSTAPRDQQALHVHSLQGDGDYSDDGVYEDESGDERQSDDGSWEQEKGQAVPCATPSTSGSWPTKPPKLVHESLKAIRQQVDALVSGPLLPVPSASTNLTFPTHTKLRIHATAAALQRGFNLFLTGGSGATFFHLGCMRSHSRFGSSRCGYLLRIERDEDGRWRVVKQGSCEHHNHPKDPDLAERLNPHASTSALPAVTPPFTQARKRLREDDTEGGAAPPAPKRQSSKSHAVGRPASSSVSSSRFPTPLSASYPSPNPSPAPPVPVTTGGRVEPPTAPASGLPSFVPTLRAFLAALSPSLAAFAPLLLSSGLQSIESLVNLLRMDDDVVAAWVAELGNGTAGTGAGGEKLPKIQQVLLRNAVRNARNEIGEMEMYVKPES